MNTSFDRVSQDIQNISAYLQHTVGRVSEELFGYTTTPETNAFIMYAFLLLLLVVAVRIISVTHGTVIRTGMPLSNLSGYDFRRYG